MPNPITDNQKTYTTQAICLRAFDYGEGDRIVHLYTPDEGRVSAIAKGVRRTKSKLAGVAERLHLNEVQLSRGRNLEMVCQYLPKETYPGLRTDILKLAYGMLYSDLVYATDAANANSQEIFTLLCQALKTLSDCAVNDIVSVGLRFQLELLQIIGMQPELETCILTGDDLPFSTLGETHRAGLAVTFCFSSELGGISTIERRKQHSQTEGLMLDRTAHGWVNISSATIAILSTLSESDISEALTESSWTEAQLIKAQNFLRFYFGKVFEKDIQAYDLLFKLLQPIAPNLNNS